ncbi:GSCFA domain-containing protein [Maribacter litopenaei]|uniref:GSCFA domain-containing protein n=1 Tax=Maribacter litopenaei TaxID=2976127 RepID=UPI00308416A1
MKLQTKVPLSKTNKPIDYSSRVLILGSCFSKNIGAKLQYYKFQTLQNPFGILFHPLSIENLVKRTTQLYKYSEDDIFELNGRWHCFDAHSELSSGQKEELLHRLNSAVLKTNQFLKEASHITITLGTAWVYRHIENGLFVANCHKVPQREFQKVLLNEGEILTSINNMVVAIRTINTQAQIIFTISPVRHLKGGFVENQRSKSNLIAAIHNVIDSESSAGGHGVVYFPSYEIMMDELRDYRFYKEDMVHPNALAIDYIRERFSEVSDFGKS